MRAWPICKRPLCSIGPLRVKIDSGSTGEFHRVRQNGSTGRIARLPGGPFLMGTHYEEVFQDNGEGPVRRVMLEPF